MCRSLQGRLTRAARGGKLGFLQGYGLLRAHFASLLLHELLLSVRV